MSATVGNEEVRPLDITVDSVIEMYHAQKPKLVWRVGKNTLPRLQKLTDDCGRFLMGTIERKHREPDTTLLGHPVEIVEGYGLRLITVGGNRE